MVDRGSVGKEAFLILEGSLDICDVLFFLDTLVGRVEKIFFFMLFVKIGSTTSSLF